MTARRIDGLGFGGRRRQPGPTATTPASPGRRLAGGVAIAALLVSTAAAQRAPSLYIPSGPVTAADVHPAPTALEASARNAGATPDRYVVDYLMVPMRDGVRLQTVVIRPRDDGRHPTIIDRTPYQTGAVPGSARLAFARGYALVVQNERGSEWSEGEFHFLGRTANDAYDTLSWIAAQPWSNGRVGAEGCSSSAENQLKLGTMGHPALTALVPMSAGAGVGAIPGVTSQGLFFKGGVPMIGTWSLWYAPFAYVRRPKLPPGLDAEETARALRNYAVTSPGFQTPSYNQALGESVRAAPSRDVLARLEVPANDFARLMASTSLDPIWRRSDLIDAADTGATPSLNINGWYDVGAYETVKLFEFQQQHPDQYLIMAPSPHCQMTRTSTTAKIGDRPVGDSSFAYDELAMRWFDSRVAGKADAWTPMPRVQVFLMGANGWLTGDRWPLPETRTDRLYLAGGSANTADGKGLLQPGGPGADAVDRFAYDPKDATPTLGEGMLGPVSTDQRAVERRRDVLVYSTPVLTEGLALVGDLRAVLEVSADVLDTDVAVKLVDVYPDGTAYNVAGSIQRLRYRDGVARPSLLRRGRIYRVTIGEMVTGNYFAPGHRLRLEITGADFPNSDRNWNTGGANERATSGPVAHVAVHHGARHPSYLEFTRYTGTLPARPGPPPGGVAR